MCAVWWHNTEPHGGHVAVSASAFAAVPLVTGNTRGSWVFEHVANDLLQLFGDLVAAVRHSRTGVGSRHRSQDLRSYAGRIVATKLNHCGLRTPRSRTPCSYAAMAPSTSMDASALIPMMVTPWTSISVAPTLR